MNVRRDEPGLRSETVRRSNLSALARELHEAGPTSRSELGSRTGLTRSAIRALIGEFVIAELVSEEPSAPLGAPGRPSSLVYPHPERAVGLALEIAVDSVSAAVVGFGGQVLELVRVDNPRGEMSVELAVGKLAELAAMVRGLPPQREEVVGIGVGVVGVVRRSDGFVSMAPNLGWRDVALGHALRRALDTLIPIFVANEADLGALAELRRGAARGRQHVLFVSGEVGVGGGLIIDGRPLTGGAGYGGEIGHMPFNPEPAACRCGSVGCWETQIGEDALLTLAGHRGAGGREAVEMVLREAEAGSPVARAALEKVGAGLGRGLAGLVNALNLELVVLGGLFGRIYPFVDQTIERQLDRYALAAPRRAVSVVPAALQADAPLLGAAELAFEPFLVDPARWLRPRAGLLELRPA
ncbi:MAG TPA: ROK family protein [Candidatus Limnocylindria bacterium]|nr:ROK family protein [Candidatus Limnocylindria bacterium]